MSVWKWYVSAFLSIFIDMASLDALWETFDKGCIKIKEAHIGEVIKTVGTILVKGQIIRIIQM